MPIYEYRCKDCHQVFEEWSKSFEDHTERSCPICSGSSERIMSSTSFVLRGGGWYVTDYGYRKGANEGGGPGASQGASEGVSADAPAGATATSAPAASETGVAAAPAAE